MNSITATLSEPGPEGPAGRAKAAGAALAGTGRRLTARHLLTVLLLTATAHAERLATDGWRVEPEAARAVLDGDGHTAWTSAGPQAPGLAVTFDRGRPVLVHRVALRTGDALSGFARGLAVEVSDDGRTWTTAAAVETLNEPDLDLRFNPVVGRWLRLRLTASAGTPWSLAEAAFYGSPDPNALDRETVIALPDEPTPPARWAAEELRYYLGEATGRFPTVQAGGAARGKLVFVLGPTPTAAEATKLKSLGEEGTLITRVGSQVRLVGGSPRGLLYGCYELLDRLGVKWLDPTPAGEFIPRGAKLDLSALPVAAGPSFTWRHCNGWSFDQMPRAWVLWTVRNRINCIGQAAGWYAHLDRYLGATPARGRYLYGHYPHSFARTLPGSLFKDHPEMFPERGGRRVPYDSVPGGGLQFCTTSPATQDYVVNHIVQVLKARPDDLYSLCPNDGGVWCECAECLKLDEPVLPETYSDGRPDARSVSDRFFGFLDQVCRRVDQALPGRRILTIAYSNFDQPPRRIERLPDNLSVDVCQYGCSSHGVNECERNAEMKRRLEEWARKCADVGVYDYTFDQMKVQKLPLPYCRAINEELRWLAGIGIRAYSTEGAGSGAGWLYSPWAYWVMARSLWNTGPSAASLTEQFFTAYYQEAAAPMRAYYQAMEDHAYRQNVCWGSYNNVPTADKFPPELLATLRRHLDSATAAARQPLIRERVARQVEAIDFCEEYLKRGA